MQQKQGLIAILDALGAAMYSDADIERFLESRQRVLGLLDRNAQSKEIRGQIDKRGISTFTFNDTILIVYRTPRAPTLEDVKHFALLLRKFAVDSLAEGILFRGALSVGAFYVDDESNTVMGDAVTDAAAWYDSADWIGIHATPHASLLLQSLMERDGDALGHALVDYPVPMKTGALHLKAINWPKVFVVAGLAPKGTKGSPRAMCLSLLTKHRVPRGTENKYFNTMAFFDHCIQKWRDAKKRSAG